MMWPLLLCCCVGVGASVFDVKALCGTILNGPSKLPKKPASESTVLSNLPDRFDAREHFKNCATVIGHVRLDHTVLPHAFYSVTLGISPPVVAAGLLRRLKHSAIVCASARVDSLTWYHFLLATLRHVAQKKKVACRTLVMDDHVHPLRPQFIWLRWRST